MTESREAASKNDAAAPLAIALMCRLSLDLPKYKRTERASPGWKPAAPARETLAWAMLPARNSPAAVAPMWAAGLRFQALMVASADLPDGDISACSKGGCDGLMFNDLAIASVTRFNFASCSIPLRSTTCRLLYGDGRAAGVMPLAHKIRVRAFRAHAMPIAKFICGVARALAVISASKVSDFDSASIVWRCRRLPGVIDSGLDAIQTLISASWKTFSRCCARSSASAASSEQWLINNFFIVSLRILADSGRRHNRRPVADRVRRLRPG